MTKKTVDILFLLLVFIVIGRMNANAQYGSELCVCFEPNTEHIDLSFGQDSSMVAFNIVLEGFETEEQREQAWEEYRQGPPTDDRYPVFYNVYVSNKSPETLSSVEELDNCSVLVSVHEFRRKNFRYPPGVGGSRIIFIQKNPDGTFLKWNTTFFE